MISVFKLLTFHLLEINLNYKCLSNVDERDVGTIIVFLNSLSSCFYFNHAAFRRVGPVSVFDWV
jgi:hypothetical protein